MNKRKKATSPASTRSARAAHLPGPPRTTASARATGAKAKRPDRAAGKHTAAGRPRSKAAALAQPTSFALAAECMVANAIALKASLAGVLNQSLPVTLDVTALRRIDTAGLQVITAFVRARAARGLLVEWQGTAPVLTAAAQLLGLTSLLELTA